MKEYDDGYIMIMLIADDMRRYRGYESVYANLMAFVLDKIHEVVI